MVSGLRLEFQDFRAPEAHFRGFRGSGSKITIFELQKPMFAGVGFGFESDDFELILDVLKPQATFPLGVSRASDPRAIRACI